LSWEIRLLVSVGAWSLAGAALGYTLCGFADMVTPIVDPENWTTR
jgi:hypothetical protein